MPRGMVGHPPFIIIGRLPTTSLRRDDGGVGGVSEGAATRLKVNPGAARKDRLLAKKVKSLTSKEVSYIKATATAGPCLPTGRPQGRSARHGGQAHDEDFGMAHYI